MISINIAQKSQSLIQHGFRMHNYWSLAAPIMISEWPMRRTQFQGRRIAQSVTWRTHLTSGMDDHADSGVI
jgi:hypothetical protein